MAGIYLHIPFCQTRCSYCDFYSTTQLQQKEAFVDALCREIGLRAAYLEDEHIQTIYLGGGTPSQLTADDLHRLFDTLGQYFNLSQLTEVTLEANPDDLTEAYIASLKHLPINRLSIGIQTFDEAILRVLHRRHTAQQSVDTVRRCQDAGLTELSIDLMYGLPGQTLAGFERDIEQALELHPPHLSAYHLTYEKGTALYARLQRKEIQEIDEEASVLFFETLRTRLHEAGYQGYEISNFCLPNHHAQHNTAYWQGVPYLGLGPSAHSFNGRSRSWNIASLEQYIAALEQGIPFSEEEELSPTTQYNEYIITGLRTTWGIDTEVLRQRFGETLYRYALQMATPHLSAGRILATGSQWTISSTALFLSDSIMSDLLWVED